MGLSTHLDPPYLRTSAGTSSIDTAWMTSLHRTKYGKHADDVVSPQLQQVA